MSTAASFPDRTLRLGRQALTSSVEMSMRNNKPADEASPRRDVEGRPAPTGRSERKPYAKPTITFCEPMVNVTLFSAGASPNSQSPPFIPAS